MALFRLPVDPGSSRKVVVLLVLVFLVFSGMKAFQRYGTGTSSKVGKAEKYEYADQTAPQVTPERMLYPTVPDDLIRLEREQEEKGILPGIADPLVKTVSWLHGEEGRKLFLSPLNRSMWHHDNLIREPSRWRMKPMHIYGELVDKQVIDYPDNPPGLRKIYLLTLFDRFDFNYFRLLTPHMPVDAVIHVDSTDDKRGYAGDNLAADGIFLMSYTYSTPGGSMSAPLFYAPTVYPAIEGSTPPPLYSEIPGEDGKLTVQKPMRVSKALDMRFVRSVMYYPPKTGDSNPLFRTMCADLRSEKPALTHIFEYLWSLDKDKVARLGKNPEINYVSLMGGEKAPDWMHGQTTSVHGVVMSLQTMRFPGAPDGIGHIYLITVGDLGYKEFAEYTWVLAALNLPPELRRGDQVNASGIFYKLYPYRTRQGKWHWSPVLVCRDITKVAVPASPLLPAWIPEEYLPWLFGVAAFILVFILVYIYRVSQKDSYKLEQMRQRAQQRRLEAMGIPKFRKTRTKASKKSSRKPGGYEQVSAVSSGDESCNFAEGGYETVVADSEQAENDRSASADNESAPTEEGLSEKRHGDN